MKCFLVLYTMLLLLMLSSVAVAEDALAEVNAARVKIGKTPFIRDDGLTVAASICANFRARRWIHGHTGNDFNALPKGVIAKAAGCASWPPHLGWGSCCTYEDFTYAGAAYAIGSDGRRYMHLFVR